MFAIILVCLSTGELTFEDRSLSAWVERLRSQDAARRADALRTFQQLGSEARSAVPAICKHLQDDNPAIRIAALHALGFIGPDAKEAVTPLLQLSRQRGTPLGLIGNTFARLGPDAIDELKQTLKHENLETRRSAVLALRHVRPIDRAVVAELRRMVEQDKEAEVRVAVAATLGVFADDAIDVLTPLLAALKDKDRTVRDAAALALAAVGAPAIKPLVDILADPKNPDHALAAFALSKMGNGAKAAIPQLVRALDDPLPEVRRHASKTLANAWIHARDASARLVKLQSDPDISVRLQAAIAVYRLENRVDQAGPIVLDAVRQGDVDTRRAAVTLVQSTYGQIRNGETVLIEGLRDADPLVRQISAWAMNLFRPASDAGIKALAAGLKDREPTVREAAAHSLHQLRAQARPVLPAVVDALARPDSALRLHLPLILRAHPVDAIPLLIARSSSNEETMRVGVFAALAEFGGEAKTALPNITKALEDRSPLVQLNAAAALAQVGPRGKAPLAVFEKALHDPNIDLRREAASLLDSLYREAGAAALLELALKDSEPEVRLQAVRSAALFGGAVRPVLSSLGDRLIDRDHKVRLEAVNTFKALGKECEAALPWLIKGLRDSDLTIQESLAELLRSLVKDVELTLIAGLAHEERRVREGAVVQLGRKAVAFGPVQNGEIEARREKIIKAMLTATEDREPTVRRAAMLSLRLWNRQRAIDPTTLKKCLGDSDLEVRCHAALAFIHANQTSEECLPALVDAIKRGPPLMLPGFAPTDAFPDDYDRALKSLQTFGPRGRRVLPALVRLLDDPRSVVRKASALILGTMGEAAKDATDALHRTSKKDANAEVRVAAAQALQRIAP